ncbi:hypothetical protein ANN_10559 [Periplaneta americana]|uniref:Uncharacterized protein n=1 Tax=Periplaneta americana TaxID=6978 RepID=A0ABQ8TPB8_PERAM|nr:hypothetical protein ANN_10559 [Periplaneta americana]
MSPGSSTESYPAFSRAGLRENPGKNLNQVTCPDWDSNPSHLVSLPDALTVTPQLPLTVYNADPVTVSGPGKDMRTDWIGIYYTEVCEHIGGERRGHWKPIASGCRQRWRTECCDDGGRRKRPQNDGKTDKEVEEQEQAAERAMLHGASRTCNTRTMFVDWLVQREGMRGWSGRENMAENCSLDEVGRAGGGELRERLSVVKRVEQQANINRFNILKLKDEETKQRYLVEISNRFAALATADEAEEELDVNSVWDNIRDNIKIAAEQSIGYLETKKKKPWFDEDCSIAVDRRNQAKLKFLQEPIVENRDNYFNERGEASRTLRNKKRDYLKEN